MERVVIIGAGPAGLAAAAALKQRGVEALVVDKAPAVGASWRGHYERLHLHTERALSSLPGLPFPRAFGKWVPRAKVVEYLEEYARHHALRLRLGVEVQRVERGFSVHTAEGPIEAAHVVIATGYNHTPFLPDWPGREGFTGELLHSARYKNPAPYKGRDVLVVGTGNSGAEIAVDLLEGGAARVRVAVRTPPNIVPREIAGVSAQRLGVMLRHLPPAIVDPIAGAIVRFTVGDLRPHGLPRSPRGTYTRAREGQIPILDVGFLPALKAGRVGIVGAVRGFEGPEVLLEGGERLRTDAVIAATGFRRGLESLVGHLGLLAPDGSPRESVQGLHFIGYANPISGAFREMGIEARRLAIRMQAE